MRGGVLCAAVATVLVRRLTREPHPVGEAEAAGEAAQLIAEGIVLACQSVPVTDTVKITYE